MSKPKREPSTAETILGLGFILFLIFSAVQCQKNEKAQDAAIQKIAQDYVTGIEIHQNWHSVKADDSTDANKINVSITYNRTPKMQTVIDDTMIMARAILAKLILTGYTPTADDISITVYAGEYHNGETNTVNYVSYGRARYSALKDNLEFKLPE